MKCKYHDFAYNRDICNNMMNEKSTSFKCPFVGKEEECELFEEENHKDEIDYKQKYEDLIASINTTPFVTSPMGDLPVTSTTVRNLLDKLIKTEEENHNLSDQLYNLNLYIDNFEEIQNNNVKHLIDLIKRDVPKEYHKQIDETTNIFLGVQNGNI